MFPGANTDPVIFSITLDEPELNMVAENGGLINLHLPLTIDNLTKNK